MTNTVAGIYVVATSKGNMTVYWAAATPQADAVAAVEQRLPPGWTAILTDRRSFAVRALYANRCVMRRQIVCPF